MARRQKPRSKVLIVSVGAHVVVAAILALVPQQKLREIVAIAMSEADPKKEEKKPEPPKPPERSTDKPQRSAARNARPAPAPGAESRAQNANAFTDIGLALDSSSADGIAIAIARPEPVLAPVIAAPPKPKVLVAKPTESACAEPLVKPRLLKQGRPPSFTDEARRARVEGIVRVAVDVDEKGNVVTARLLKGLGYGLDEAAVEAARRAVFAAATQCNKPVAASFVFTMRFRAST